MGRAKQRRQAILDMNQPCIFCAGHSLATTEDHQPARALFDGREWPEGYAFPACEPCNRASKDAEHKLALLVRIDAENFDDPRRQEEFRKFIGAMGNNFPGLLKPLSTNEKRRFFKSEGITRPPGVALVDVHAAGIEADAAEKLFGIAMDKILRALHWKHTGNIVRWGEGVKASWYTNAYFEIFYQSEDAQFYTNLPVRPPIMRNKHDLSDQFVYRYGKDDAGELSAFLIAFRNSFIVTGIVAQSDEVLAAIRAQEASQGPT
jgi:hypothetical protein